MIDDKALDDWFCREVLPLERALTRFIRRNWKVADDVMDLRHDVYALVLASARRELPANARQYLFMVARNHLISSARRARVVSFEHVADLEALDRDIDMLGAERHMSARDGLRRVLTGLEKLSPRVREIVELRKIEGLTPQETAERLGIGKDAVNGQLVMGMRALANHMLGGSGKIVRPRYGARNRGGKP